MYSSRALSAFVFAVLGPLGLISLNSSSMDERAPANACTRASIWRGAAATAPGSGLLLIVVHCALTSGTVIFRANA